MENIGKISFERQTELGRGYGGTLVCRGRFEQRNVAVKILSKNYFKFFQREVSILQSVDSHPNVVRYFCSEEDNKYYYIALEMCTCTLDEWISRSDLVKKINPTKILYETALGLSFLHTMTIIHRDIKPQNVLLCIQPTGAVTKLSDFGMAKDFSHDSQSTVSSMSLSDNWMAPELSSHHKANRSTDVYSLGCVYYYTLTQGQNLRENSKVLSSKQGHSVVLANALIMNMTKLEPNQRPTSAKVASNPLFWKAEKLLNFIVDISNKLEKRDSSSDQIRSEMKTIESDIVGGDWLKKLDAEIVRNLQQRRGYNGTSMEDLIRAIRNKRAHYEETSNEIKEIFGQLPEKFLHYWTSRFPKLIHALYIIANRYLLNDPTFHNLYLSE
ncbi:serine/threonine-protein kinase/endoribonuclease IRE2-like [Bradysia coprophila]|uniref:serine/threonine-protein kinase/endoribonuclease IRE2-like n=1 Tax=Bradysia coprophila TaxID=38358 RepID=UPI00187DB57B|nr:serine/threonine-protein kinase/endoribonuclease IRE2-like [Bradysia coprophila]